MKSREEPTKNKAKQNKIIERRKETDRTEH
jgi:hypothetical protein